MYDLIKPLRNRLRNIELQSLLELIHSIQMGHEDDLLIRYQISPEEKREVFRWELHLLAREAILHSSIGRGKKADRPEIANLVDKLRLISEGISKKTIGSRDDALRALHPLVHQQTRWQNKRDWDRFYRVYCIYKQPDLQQTLYRVVGIRLQSIYTMMLAVAGGVVRSSSRIVSTNDYGCANVFAEERDAFFALVGAPLAKIQEAARKLAKDDESWAFTWNPLEGSPLIQLSPDFPHQYLCPFPEFLLRRATDSLFFDLMKSDEAPGKAYGAAYQSYVGDVLKAQFRNDEHKVLEEREYRVGKDRKDGVDWVVTDLTGHLMVECKARRLPVDAKAATKGEALDRAIGDMAKSVLQHYKNINDALNGRTHWQPDGKPVFAMVVTLDNWNIVAPHVVEALDDGVRVLLDRAGLASLASSVPFVIASIDALESFGQAVAQIGIDAFFSGVSSLPSRHSGLLSHAYNAFPEVRVDYKRLFESAGQEMLGHLSQFMVMPGAHLSTKTNLQA